MAEGQPIARPARIIIASFGGEGSEYCDNYYVKLHCGILGRKLKILK